MSKRIKLSDDRRVGNPEISEEALQYRLALGATTAKGGRGTLSRVAHRFLSSASLPNAREEKEELERELRLLQIEMNKQLLVLERVRCEIRQLDGDQAASGTNHETAAGTVLPTSSSSPLFSDLAKQVTSLRRQVSTAQQAQSFQVEYEALAALLHRRHATPFRTLQSQVESIEQQIESTSREVHHKQSTVRIRSSQIHLLVQSIMDLKQSLLVNDVAMATGQTDSITTVTLPAGTGWSSGEFEASREAVDEHRKGYEYMAPSTRQASTQLGKPAFAHNSDTEFPLLASHVASSTAEDITHGDRDDEVEEGEEIDRGEQNAQENDQSHDDDLYCDLEDSSR
jgi:hypothetical protein